ncbi:MAG TPA: ABC transporter ATP-binding protein [Candidatus Saccharibacteria bacterium]|nr:ABC transporter ATP-binding protein [Candidatus Saccharibacteria bacterium]
MATAIRLSRVTKQFSNGKGIHNVNLHVEGGQIFGFLGPNGAGKTTTIRCIMDFIRPQAGTVRVFSKSAQDSSSRQQIGYVPSDPQLYPNWTGSDHLSLYESIRGKTGLDNTIKRLGLDMSVRFKHLSSGNKQKLALLLAFAGSPKLLIMDEPTKGLDPLLQQTIYDLLREFKAAGGTVFLSSHNLPEVEKVCDRVAVIREGQIVADQTMGSIREMSIHIISAVTSKPVGSSSLKLEGVTVLHHTGTHLLLKVKGDLNPIMHVLSGYTLKDLEVNHASLEDIFMEYYT